MGQIFILTDECEVFGEKILPLVSWLNLRYNSQCLVFVDGVVPNRPYGLTWVAELSIAFSQLDYLTHNRQG